MTAAGSRLTLWTVAGLTAAGLLLRAPRLAESLWYDEIAAWATHGANGPGAIVASFREPSNHIAHTLLSWCAVELFQRSLGFELALRLPALLFSLGAIGAMWGLAREVAAPRVAAIAAGLMAVLPVAVLEGAEARGYSMVICLSALASWTLLANARDEKLWRWALYAMLCAVAVWTHFVAAFLPIGHAAWLAWGAARRGRVRLAIHGAMALVAAAATTIALYAPAIPDLLASRGMYVAARGNEPSVFGPQGWHALLQLGGSWYAWAALPGLALFAVGLAKARDLRDAAAVTLLGLPIFVAVVLASGSWMYARFALFSLPGAILMIAAGIETLWVWRRAAGIAAAAAVAVASLADLAVRPVKQPLRDAADYVRQRYEDDQRILVIGLAHGVMHLYLGDLDTQYSFLHGFDLETMLPEADPDWIVMLYPNSVSPAVYALLESRGYVLATRFRGWADWNNGDVLVYRRIVNGHDAPGTVQESPRR